MRGRRVVDLSAPTVVMGVGAALMLLAAVVLVSGVLEAGHGVPGLQPFGFYHPGALAMAALVATALGLLALAGSLSRTRDTPERLELRRRLAAARQMFREQLAEPEPRLRDEWFPYLVAFGLGRHVDRWFRAFGSTAARTRVGGAVAASASSGGGSSWTGGGPQFGGGGGFGGGGAGGAWSVAAASMAGGVSTPSSGGGGGGAASGGGGGGGW